jgi:hypothetical protein
MTKEEYYKTSDKLKLPRRCPLYENCERRVWSVFFLTYYQTSNKTGDLNDSIPNMKSEGDVPQDYENNFIRMVGAPPEIHKGFKDYYRFDNFCPELLLFTPHKPIALPKLAISTASYGKNNGRYIKEKEVYKHFSECQEFAKHRYEKQKPKSERRENISVKTRFEVFQRDKFTCKYCSRTNEDGIKLELDHVVPVSKGGKNEKENLVTSCYECNRGKGAKEL